MRLGPRPEDPRGQAPLSSELVLLWASLPQDRAALPPCRSQASAKSPGRKLALENRRKNRSEKENSEQENCEQMNIR
jgi:hypothetical protein